MTSAYLLIVGTIVQKYRSLIAILLEKSQRSISGFIYTKEGRRLGCVALVTCSKYWETKQLEKRKKVVRKFWEMAYLISD